MADKYLPPLPGNAMTAVAGEKCVIVSAGSSLAVQPGAHPVSPSLATSVGSPSIAPTSTSFGSSTSYASVQQGIRPELHRSVSIPILQEH